MSLPWREKLSMLLPPSVFYRRRIDYETATGEPELALLDKLMRHGATAVDIGANQGFFAFALAELSRRVVCFEPNPDYARFARWMLRGRAEVHAVALADKTARANFYVPHSDEGLVLHLAGSLKRAHHHFKTIESYEVEVRTLDDFALTDVSFIKLDVEGSERDVLEGARADRARAAAAADRASFRHARRSRRADGGDLPGFRLRGIPRAQGRNDPRTAGDRGAGQEHQLGHGDRDAQCAVRGELTRA